MDSTKTKFTGRAIVGIDLDGVCADYTSGFRRYAARILNRPERTFPEPLTYNLVNAGWGFDSASEYLATHRAAVDEGLYQHLPVINGAAEALREISDAGAHIRIVTHRLIMGGRHARVVSDTATWLDEYKIPYMSLCFTGLKDSVGAHVYVEDAPKNIETLRAIGLETFVFDQPYNQEVSGPRIFGWDTGGAQIINYLRASNQIN